MKGNEASRNGAFTGRPGLLCSMINLLHRSNKLLSRSTSLMDASSRFFNKTFARSTKMRLMQAVRLDTFLFNYYPQLLHVSPIE